MLVKFGRAQARALLPHRKNTNNKSHGGRSLVIAGSRGMYGAAILAATAAARSGSGYTTIATIDFKSFPTHRHPDFLIRAAGQLAANDFKNSAVAVGPGLGQSPRIFALLQKLSRSEATRVVVDADALNAAAKHPRFSFGKSWILTPHEGELARLLGVSAQTIRADREKYVRLAHRKLGAIVLLKGFHTLIDDGNKTYQIQSGNAALAKAGTGDVLTGLITGLLAQGLTPRDAACLGAYVHGRLADDWIAQGQDELSLLASDLPDRISSTLKILRQSK